MLVKVFVSLFALLSFIIPAEMDEFLSSPENAAETTTTGIGFGRPNKDCSGSGICMVSADFKSGLRDNFGIAKITLSSRGGISNILILRESLTSETIQKHFSGSHFMMESPYQGKLKMGGKDMEIRIPAGKYKIKKSKEGFLLEVTG